MASLIDDSSLTGRGEREMGETHGKVRRARESNPRHAARAGCSRYADG